MKEKIWACRVYSSAVLPSQEVFVSVEALRFTLLRVTGSDPSTSYALLPSDRCLLLLVTAHVYTRWRRRSEGISGALSHTRPYQGLLPHGASIRAGPTLHLHLDGESHMGAGSGRVVLAAACICTNGPLQSNPTPARSPRRLNNKCKHLRDGCLV